MPSSWYPVMAVVIADTRAGSDPKDSYDRPQRMSWTTATPLGIPLLYGVDAVHGNQSLYGATIYPHNIGLGAAGDPDLVERIARATAVEMAATGVNWTFGPCVAVVQDTRWGRSYESFGSDPALVSAMTTAITGYQEEGILATAKHYLADGGTAG